MRKNVWIDAYKHHLKGLVVLILLCATFFFCVLYDWATKPSTTIDVLYSNWWIVVAVMFIPLGFWAGLNQLKREKGTEFKITTLKEIKGKKMDFKTFEEKVVATIESILRDAGLDFEKIREKKGGFMLTSFTLPTYGFRVEPRLSFREMHRKEVNLLIGPKNLYNKEVVEKVKQKIDAEFM
ncbi:MAG: hypothetical protein KJ655_05580 [Candidatus Thermoplasmatota archaeon]|nr:hypothetical protein [Candidatus Thermoplasmatota archaeon]